MVGITDASGNVLAGYIYDEWGKLLEITAAGNSVLYKKLAELNPLRYRGYYYDNETGYYYLQSRYYDPEIGRFISADGFSYINNNKPLNTNAYVYCSNSPIVYVDPTGTKQEHGWVSDAGRAVAEIISTIFLCLDAMSRSFVAATQELSQKASENFAAIIASMVISNKSILYPSGNSHQERHNKVVEWLDAAAESFAEFIQTSFYKVINFVNDNFFLEFFNHVVDTGKPFYNYTLKEIITFTFGFGDNDLLSSINDFFSGKF